MSKGRKGGTGPHKPRGQQDSGDLARQNHVPGTQRQHWGHVDTGAQVGVLTESLAQSYLSESGLKTAKFHPTAYFLGIISNNQEAEASHQLQASMTPQGNAIDLLLDRRKEAGPPPGPVPTQGLPVLHSGASQDYFRWPHLCKAAQQFPEWGQEKGESSGITGASWAPCGDFLIVVPRDFWNGTEFSFLFKGYVRTRF